MAVYITATALSVLLAYISSNLSRTPRLKGVYKRLIPGAFAFLSVLPLMLVMAVRENVGSDFGAYANAFRHGGSMRMEAGYSLLNNWLHSITNDYHVIFIATSIIICACYFYAIYKESIDPAYSVLLFVLCEDYFIAMNGVRQYLAIAIFLLAIPCIKRKAWIKTVIIFLIAFSFHKSVVIFIPILVMYFINIRPVVGAGMVAGTFLFSQTVLRYLLPVLQRFNFYSSYFSAQSHYRNVTGNFIWRFTLIFLCFFLLLAYEYNSVKKSKELKLMYSGVLTSLLIMSLSSVMPIILYRFTWYANPLLALYTPLAIKTIQDKRIGKLLSFLIPVMFAITYIPMILRGNQDVLPYHTMWSR